MLGDFETRKAVQASADASAAADRPDARTLVDGDGESGRAVKFP